MVKTILSKKNAAFSFTTHWISLLGDSRRNTFILFNLITIFYSFFNLFFINKVRLLLPDNLLGKSSIFLFYIYALSLILILFYPVNKNYKVHRVLSDIIFSSLLGWITLMLFPLYKTQVPPSSVLLLLTITVLLGFVFLFSFTKLRIKYKEIPKTLVDLQKSEKSLLIKNSCLMEWVFFFLVIICQLFLIVISSTF